MEPVAGAQYYDADTCAIWVGDGKTWRRVDFDRPGHNDIPDARPCTGTGCGSAGLGRVTMLFGAVDCADCNGTGFVQDGIPDPVPTVSGDDYARVATHAHPLTGQVWTATRPEHLTDSMIENVLAELWIGTDSLEDFWGAVLQTDSPSRDVKVELRNRNRFRNQASTP